MQSMGWAWLLGLLLLVTASPVFLVFKPSRERNPVPTMEIMVPARDGVHLLTRVWLPPDGSPGTRFPTVLTRGYRAGNAWDAARFNAAGYAYVGQAARGEPGSEGELNRFFADADDGYDNLTWISEQPWSDGNIAMYGRSYWGATQWAVAPLQHPNLKAIIPQNVPAEPWPCGYRCNGALTLAMAARGRAYEHEDQARRFGWEALYRHLPLIDLDVAVSGKKNQMWRDYVTRDAYDEYWSGFTMRGKYDQIKIPVLLLSGWYDYYAGAALDTYAALRAAGSTADVRVAINPSDHINRVVGDRDFGPDAAKDDPAIAVRWLDHVMLGGDNGAADEAPIRIFTMGVNEWRYENEWPLARTRFTPFYFHSPDGSRTGTLDTTSPGDEAPIGYRYDPEDPVPTLGGNHSFLGADHPELIRVGSVDQRPNEQRDDVLVFTSAPLEEDVEVTGPVDVVLYAASSARDTDFTAKLIDVHPDGTAYNLTEGIIRARFRKSVWGEPILLTPGEVYRYTLRLHPTSNVFRRGHRIRVHLTSSNFPLWDRNPNTGNPQGLDDQLMTAEQTVYHDRDNPSHILLPVIAAKIAKRREE